MKYQEIVRKTAMTMNLLDGRGKLLPLDSLSIIDFVLALETASQVQIPTASIREETFESVETIAEMLAELASR